MCITVWGRNVWAHTVFNSSNRLARCSMVPKRVTNHCVNSDISLPDCYAHPCDMFKVMLSLWRRSSRFIVLVEHMQTLCDLIFWHSNFVSWLGGGLISGPSRRNTSCLLVYSIHCLVKLNKKLFMYLYWRSHASLSGSTRCAILVTPWLAGWLQKMSKHTSSRRVITGVTWFKS